MAALDIEALNMSVLTVLRDNARTDVPLACYRFGVTHDFAQRIAAMSIEEVKRLALTANLLFSLKITPTTAVNIKNAPPHLRGALVEMQSHATA